MPSLPYRFTKRSLDLALAGVGLLVAAPLLAAAALAVKLDSPGPAFFGHRRIGRGGRKFTMWKLRSMVDSAPRSGPQVTAGGDARVTRVGRFLRSTKLDELPQLLNVLRGQMSLVGPRPEVAEYVALFADDYRTILEVRPGITDEASLAFRREEELLAAADDPQKEYVNNILPQKIEIYLDYVRHLSLRRDLSILLRTLYRVIAS